MHVKLNQVLLVDDDRSTNFFNKWLLQKEGCASDVQTFKNGQEAIDFLQDNSTNPDLILLDINMPVMNGFEFLNALRKLDSDAAQCPVIMMLTNSIKDQQKAEAETLGVHHFVRKPLTEEKLASMWSDLPAR